METHENESPLLSPQERVERMMDNPISAAIRNANNPEGAMRDFQREALGIDEFELLTGVRVPEKVTASLPVSAPPEQPKDSFWTFTGIGAVVGGGIALVIGGIANKILKRNFLSNSGVYSVIGGFLGASIGAGDAVHKEEKTRLEELNTELASALITSQRPTPSYAEKLDTERSEQGSAASLTQQR